MYNLKMGLCCQKNVSCFLNPRLGLKKDRRTEGDTGIMNFLCVILFPQGRIEVFSEPTAFFSVPR
jgi:hypothetical protein